MRRHNGCLIAVLLLAATALFAASEEKWEAGASLYTESGDYGTGSNISTVYIPFKVRRYFGPGDLELIVPFISVTSEGQVFVVQGVPNRGRGNGGGAAAVTRHTESGLGDMILKGRYYVWEERDWIPAVDAIASVKFPTANRTKGLGTGEFDEGLSLEMTKTIRPRVLALADVGYTFIGSPPGESLNNQWHFALGPGYYFIPKDLLGSLMYEESTALVNGDSHPRDLLFELEYRAMPRLHLEGGIQAGLSTGSAAFGLNLGARWKF